MKKSILVTLILAGIFVVIAGIAAARMIAVANYMNSAAQYASSHLADSPQPIVGAKVINPKLKVSSDAYYGDAVEVQITRRYQSLYNLDQDFAVTYFYQPNGVGWKRIAPPENYWGAIQNTQGDAVTVIHPQRDAKLVSNLIKVIDPVIFNACAKWNCAADLKPVTITFVTDPTSRRDPLTFLAPQLTGMPMSKQANDDYLSNIAAESLITLAQKIGFDSPLRPCLCLSRDSKTKPLRRHPRHQSPHQHDTAPPIRSVGDQRRSIHLRRFGGTLVFKFRLEQNVCQRSGCTESVVGKFIVQRVDRESSN